MCWGDRSGMQSHTGGAGAESSMPQNHLHWLNFAQHIKMLATKIIIIIIIIIIITIIIITMTTTTTMIIIIIIIIMPIEDMQ